MKKRVVLTIIGMVLTAAVSVLGTLAYLTDSDSAVNTFTVGRVDITLDEADVDEDGKRILDEDGNPVERVKGNEYHMIPGQTYIKDPTVTVTAGSEEAYIRMMLTVNCLAELDEIFAPEGAELTQIFNGYDPDSWIYVGEERSEAENAITYEFRYKETVKGDVEDFALKPLFESFTVPGTMTGEQLETIKELKITLEGHAIQAAGFVENKETEESAADMAWEAFAQQIGVSSDDQTKAE